MPRSQPTRDLETEHRPSSSCRRLKSGGGNLGDAVPGATDGGITSFAVVDGECDPIRSCPLSPSSSRVNLHGSSQGHDG